MLPRVFTISVLMTLLTLALPTAAMEEVNVYSYRQPFLITPMFDAFTRDTGIQVNVVFAKKGLLERLRREGRNSPADLIFTVDIDVRCLFSQIFIRPYQNMNILTTNPSAIMHRHFSA